MFTAVALHVVETSVPVQQAAYAVAGLRTRRSVYPQDGVDNFVCTAFLNICDFPVAYGACVAALAAALREKQRPIQGHIQQACITADAFRGISMH